ncbi:MAG: hypothetical protein RL702_2592 [Pseudomonadota bacterium]|jgi:hypothetical protein
MSLDRSAATARIARQLKHAEAQADDALIALSELMTTLLRARASTGVAPHSGQVAIMRIVEAQRSFVGGSNDLFRAHDVMSSIGRELGVLDHPDSTPLFETEQTGAVRVAA